MEEKYPQACEEKIEKRRCHVPCFKCWRTRVPPSWLVISAAIFVQVGFGLYPVIVKKFASDDNANAYIFSFYRDACTFPILIICTLIAEGKLMIPSCWILFVFALSGLIGMFGGQLLYITGVYILGPDVTGAFQPIIPVWAVVLAYMTCTEKLPSPYYLHTWAKLLGILISVGGAIELTLTDNDEVPAMNINRSLNNDTSSGSGLHFVGYIAVCFNTMFTAMYVIIQKRFIFSKPNCKWRDHPVAVTMYSYMFGALFMGIASLYFVIRKQTSVFAIPLESAYALVYAIIVNSAICYQLMTWSNLHLSSILVTAFWPVQMLVTGVASYFITGDKFAPLQYIGVFLLILGLMMVLFSSWMDERMEAGKRVIRLRFSRRRRKQSEDESCSQEDDPEPHSLVVSGSLSNGGSESRPLITTDSKHRSYSGHSNHGDSDGGSVDAPDNIPLISPAIN